MVREGIETAKRGDKAMARNLLQQATQLHPNDAMGWVWLAFVAASSPEKVGALRKFLQLRPGHPQGQEVYRKALLEWGLQAARQGDKPQARVVLSELCELDKENDAARFWLASVAPNQAEAVRILKQVVERNPRHEKARSLLHKFEPSFPLPSAPPQGPPPRSAFPSLPKPEAAKPEQHAPTKVSEPPKQAPAPPKAATGPLVLVFDESTAVQKQLAAALESKGYRVMVAADEKQLAAKADELKPEVSIIDANAPVAGGDGFVACKKVKECSKNTVVIMMLAKDSFFEKMKGRMAGATDYLTKPLESSAVIQLVERLCPK